MSSEEYVEVYRVEKRGRGPFGLHNDDWSAAEMMNSNHPTPQYDAGLPEMDDDFIKKYRFGCPNKSVMKEWIRHPSSLDRLGYKVSVYKTKKKDVISSEIQSLFLKRKSKKVGEWSVEEFCKEDV